MGSVFAVQLVERVQSWFDPPGLEAQTEEVFRAVWLRVRAMSSTRHPFHREVLDDLDRLLDQVEALPPDTLVEIDGILTSWGDVPRLHPSVARRLTREWMRLFVVTEVARVAQVADSTDYLTARLQPSESWRDRHELTVQHRLSGLRAIFLWSDGEGIGAVVAKSYSIASIDPDRAWPHEGSEAVEEWEGLGITSRLYRHAAALQPDLRWRVGLLTEQSAALRRRLHQRDPWRFAAASDPEQHPNTICAWCIDNDWAGLDKTAFGLHP